MNCSINRILSYTLLLIIFNACSVEKRISKEANKSIINSSVLANAHTGISIFDPAKNKYIYNYQGDKYFVPASNTKIATCYVAMKYLGNKLKGLKYDDENENVTIVESTGDPTLLHLDFNNHPVLEFLRSKKHILINTENWKSQALGKGWSWDDYNDPYSAERSPLPLYGNIVRFNEINNSTGEVMSYPTFFKDSIVKSEDYNEAALFGIERNSNNNQFLLMEKDDTATVKEVPFITKGFETTRKLLRDTLKTDIRTSFYTLKRSGIIYSHSTDSVLQPMMFRSDNFFAEQLLLMASNELLGEMNEEKLIETLLQSDFKDLPQKPRWVDGSGLSRYNLFTPQDFVAILNKIKNEQSIERIKTVFPTGGQGSLKNYYITDSTYIYAKTGGMSGVVSLSGYLYTNKNKLLLFSVLVNNHQSSATEVRRTIEQFLKKVRNSL